MRSIRVLADQLMLYGYRCGLMCDYHVAQTETRYLKFTNFDDSKFVTIRIADHADAYGRADYTVDNIEGTAAGARKLLSGWALQAGPETEKMRNAYKAWDAWNRASAKAAKFRGAGTENPAAEAAVKSARAKAAAIIDRFDLPREWGL